MIHNLARGQQAFTSNAFLVTGERTTLVDVGNEFDIVAAIEDVYNTADSDEDQPAPVDLDAIVLTHTHFDHVANLDDVLERFEVDVFACDGTFDGVDARLDDGETIQLDDHEYVALYTPGHKEDHLCLYADQPGVLFAGDLVFAGGGFGRTDLDEGHRPTLVDSIERVLDRTNDSLTELHTGHGESVTSDPYGDIERSLEAARFGAQRQK